MTSACAISVLNLLAGCSHLDVSLIKMDYVHGGHTGVGILLQAVYWVLFRLVVLPEVSTHDVPQWTSARNIPMASTIDTLSKQL